MIRDKTRRTKKTTVQGHHLETLQQRLRQLPRLPRNQEYHIPRIWTRNGSGTLSVQPGEFYADTLAKILDREQSISQEKSSDGDWTRNAVIYNLFVRLTTAFDHDRNGTLKTEPLACGLRETGTLLKTIALLPYIESLGANTIYLLPITTIGRTNRKGNLGSPYAIRDPFSIDPMLDEPALCLSADFLLKAFVEAAHLLGMKVVFEFVFRTASIDSDWISPHPSWFYWLSADAKHYGAPEFDAETLHVIYEKVDKHELQALPVPSGEYTGMFVPPPVSTEKQPDGSILGRNEAGAACRVASAFSDWPPDDRQPPWTDVTYLKMHNHEHFNYIAYNTIRMYDAALDDPETFNVELWKTIVSIIPWYQENYDIDGAMMDMGHALPGSLKKRIVETARETKPDFAFWDENFDPSPAVREEGFNAVFGSLPFVIHDTSFTRGLLNHLDRSGVALPFFGTGENHNTPRLCHRWPCLETGRNRVRFVFTLCAVLPAVPFLHSGMEICEWHPVNLGINFSDSDRKTFQAEKLPLFSSFSYDWTETNGLEPLNSYIKTVLDIRNRYAELVQCGKAGSIVLPYVTEPELFAVLRKNRRQSLLFIGNSNGEELKAGTIEFAFDSAELFDLIGRQHHTVSEHRLTLACRPGECMLFELPRQD